MPMRSLIDNMVDEMIGTEADGRIMMMAYCGGIARICSFVASAQCDHLPTAATHTLTAQRRCSHSLVLNISTVECLILFRGARAGRVKFIEVFLFFWFVFILFDAI